MSWTYRDRGRYRKHWTVRPRPYVVATTPIFREEHFLLERAQQSLPEYVDWLPYSAAIRSFNDGVGMFENESQMRDFGRRAAVAAGADWWLQLDADEYLEADLLQETLAAIPDEQSAYPVLFEQPSGTGLAPFKLIHRPERAHLVCGCDHFVFRDDETVYCLSGYPVERDRAKDWRRIRLVHTPDLRPAWRRDLARLSVAEGVLEPRPPNAVQWVVPSNVRRNMSSEQTTEKPYYCPGCGARYETPGDCIGTVESPHEAIQVEKAAPGIGAQAVPQEEKIVEVPPILPAGPVSAVASEVAVAPEVTAAGDGIEDRLAALEAAVAVLEATVGIKHGGTAV